jgi:hypothetical protein
MDPIIHQLNQFVQHIEDLNEQIEVYEEILAQIFEDMDSEQVLKEDFISEEEKKKWIQDAIKKEGSLRKSMKVKEGEKIPVEKLKKAAKAKGKKGKRARLALTLRKLNK